MTLSQKKCVPCEGGLKPLNETEAKKLLVQVPGWALAQGGKAIFRKVTFDNFDKAYDFSCKVAKLAQQENHHPDIGFGWGYVKLKLWTHAIGGLHENDFIVASKINRL